METGKPGLTSAPVNISSVAAQTEKRMDIQAPLTAVYIHTVPALPAQPYPQPPAAAREPATLHLAMPPLYSKETLPFLTLHIASGLQTQPGQNLTAASPAARPKSAGKHVCPHCGRDCMKPSVLEKHLRCHTGERPYPCTTCGISFKTQSNLYKHKRTQAHARLSSESEQSSLGSLDSMSGSRETCTSSLSLDERSEELGRMEKDATLPATEIACPATTAKVFSVMKHGSVGEQSELTPAGHKNKEANETAKVTTEGDKQRMENKKPLLTASRHLTLQRQEATLFSKQWESSVSRGKSQSHESTDSGFSESSEHYPSPSSILLDHSMDSLTESTTENLEETTNTQTPSEPGQGGHELKHTAREQEKKTLEEHISKLISENSAVVEDKQLENVRPRKTVLSKQGSIDLPMPYTYKDSFHFDMRINKTPNVGLQRNKKPGFYCSVPTQHSTTTEHAPLTRSNSLPFSVTLLQPERSSPTSAHKSDYVTLVRRGSSGQINPTGFAIKPVNQQSSTHRPLVRQTAVDCNHATDGLFMNSSVEEACTGSLSCDGDGGDICGEPSNRKFRRKKAQKFAYNKWYMYGGGTFKKLYNAEKGGDDSVIKGKKCSMNQDHEIVQGLQKRLSDVHKETRATTVSTKNFTSSCAIVCHPDCSPTKLSLVSTVDFNIKTSQPHTSYSPLKSPLQRNLSLSVLPLPLIGSVISHKTDSISRADNGRLIDEVKHTDSSTQHCGSHIPSDRKKQKTDDKIICPLEMETDPNTLTHPPPSVAGSAPQQATNLTFINQNLKHTQFKGALFPPCIINANTPSVSTSPATSTHSAAKTSFLPKYQLKLPHAAEPDLNPSSHIVAKPTVTNGHSFTPDLFNTEKTPFSPSMQSCDVKKTNAFSNTQSQVLLTCTASTICHAETTSVSQNVTSSLVVVHRQFAATTITTTCLQGLCSTSVQPSKSGESSAPMQLPRPTAPMVENVPATPTVSIGNNQTSAAAITTFSQGQPKPNPPLSHPQLSLASDQLISVNREYASSNTPIVPCQLVSFEQPAAQNVFHVHTADLQICLQIISDEQLALIEPQIERQAGSTLSHRCDMEAVTPEVIQSKNQSSMESSSEGRGHQQPGHQKELEQSESLATITMERIQCGKAESNVHRTEHGNSVQATVSSESKSPEALGSSQHPHKYNNVNMVTETRSTTADVMSTAASVKVVMSGRRQTSEEEHALSLNRCAEEQLLPDRRVSQGGFVFQTLSGQHKLSMTSPSPSTVNQNNTRREVLGNESQHNLKNEGLTCNVGTMQARGEASAYKNSMLESGETQPPLQVGLGQASGTACVSELAGTVPSYSINKCKAPRQLKPQASIYCCNPADSTLSEAVNSSKHAKMGCNMASPVDNCVFPQAMTLSESQDVISSAHSEKQLGQFASASSNLQVERPKDIPAVLSSTESTTAGFMEGGCLEERASQKEPQKHGHGGNPGQSDSADCRPKQRQEAGQPKHQCMNGQGSGGVAGEDKNRGIKIDEDPGQRTKAKSNCTCLQDMTKSEVSGDNAGSTLDPQPSNNNVLEILPSKPFAYPEPADFQYTKDNSPNDYTSHSSNSGRPDISNKYQSFFFSGQLHNYRPAECLTSEVRPVQSCQDYTEDTSSSDDEGKLIIEL
uniref:zinc finger protein 831 isoform X2 n=1 Tax=Scatophagus argus TaxID=75038 RepID=UPI001ED7DD5F|nr:zinc finger protein 831 isoform X2 [Scatophagus argus]